MPTTKELWKASTEASGWADESRDLDSVELAFSLNHLCAQVFDLVPAHYLDALPDRPVACRTDPLALARQAEALSRPEPVCDFQPGISSVVVRLIDTIRDNS
ncbi:MAG: hypothetical protein Q4P07_06565 [Ornithinimicrobium sp.]|uniref:hypothetical protein n=1 Tax=Ornithinimicrobium sp. TaxID=1977084 RepID=UPI0026DEB04A|nr:hypothetical protein [Ornithinimicrobium sp.]MDO5739796.1 hypothetical protein [Ornithinimicrobium sp.]